MTLEVARRLVATYGDQVEWFAAGFPDALPEEIIDGIRIVRRGSAWTVHLQAFRRYHSIVAEQFDVVVDQVNTVPFFTPLWSKAPTHMFIHQLAREVWWYESRFPINLIGYLAEPLYLQVYRRVPVFTVSHSTEIGLRKLGFSGRITVVPEGLEPMVFERPTRMAEPAFLYVGRLAPSKRIGDIVRAFASFQKVAGQGRLWLIGDGPVKYVATLRSLVARLGIEGKVDFLGRLSREAKQRHMAQAHALLMTSVREGWGLVVTEANACGTPAVVYDVPGLRDSVRMDETGLVVEPRPSELLKGMLRLWTDKAFYNRLAESAHNWSKEFSFDKSAAVVRSQLDQQSS